MDEVLTWDTPEHHHFEKSSDWYWSLGIIAVSVAILCILLNNVLFGIFILLAAFTASLYANKPPRLIHVEVGPRSIQVEHKRFDYRGLESFWIEEHVQPQPSIILKSKKTFTPYIVIPIGHISINEVHTYLRRRLPEVEHHESIGHRILEYFGF